MDRLSDFERIIGYTFKDKSLLFEALSHSSFANESKEKLRSNERLEFLGDSVLSIVVSDYLFANYKELPEETKDALALLYNLTLGLTELINTQIG